MAYFSLHYFTCSVKHSSDENKEVISKDTMSRYLEILFTKCMENSKGEHVFLYQGLKG